MKRRGLWRFFLCGCCWLWGLPLQAQWFSRHESLMGTAIRIELWHEQSREAEAAMAAALAEMARVEQVFSPWIPTSPVARLNAAAGQAPVEVGPEVVDLIERAAQVSRLSEGAFDISFGSVGFLYDYRQGQRPDAQALAASVPLIDYRQIRIQGTRVQLPKAGMKVDFGGIGKGYAVDRAIEVLRKAGIAHAVVTAGGDSYLLGDRRGRPWMVSVRDPDQANKASLTLPLADMAVSTSGDYERYFIEDGVRYHHILQPRTGQPVQGVRSVTILANDATTADALSTTVFVLGVSKGLQLINRLEGVSAIIMDAKGQLYYSEDLTRL